MKLRIHVARYLIIPFLHLASMSSAFAELYSFRSYSVDDGLPSSIVEAVCQDSKGYLWFGTYNGVSRFDGSRFSNYSEADGLCQNYVIDIIEDSKGNLWFCTKGGGR